MSDLMSDDEDQNDEWLSSKYHSHIHKWLMLSMDSNEIIMKQSHSSSCLHSDDWITYEVYNDDDDNHRHHHHHHKYLEKKMNYLMYYEYAPIFAMMFIALMSPEIFGLNVSLLYDVLFMNGRAPMTDHPPGNWLDQQKKILRRIRNFMIGVRHSILQYSNEQKFCNDKTKWMDLGEIIRINIHLLFGEEFSQFDKLHEYKMFSQKIFHKILNMKVPQLKHSDMMYITNWASNIDNTNGNKLHIHSLYTYLIFLCFK